MSSGSGGAGRSARCCARWSRRRLPTALGGQRHEGVGGVGGAWLPHAGAAGVAEDAVDVRLPRRTEPGACVGSQARLETIEAFGIGPVVRLPLLVETARPRPVVG